MEVIAVRDGLVADAPVFELISSPTMEYGDHLNTVWRGMACPYGTTESGTAVIIKALRSNTAMATELACALAARFLKLPVPAPCIVLCDPDLIPQLPPAVHDESIRTADGQLVYFGSELVFEYPVRTGAINDPALVEKIWTNLCRNEVAPAGAAWDELVANPDRHHQNMTFDGERWWLYDHDKALAPLAELYARLADLESRNAIASHKADRNQIAAQMEIRRCDMDPVRARSRLMSRTSKPFELFVSQIDRWTHHDIRLNAIFTLTKDVLRSIQIRLPAIELLVQQRVTKEPSPPLLWED